MTFGPDDILLVADNLAAKVFALDVGAGAPRPAQPFDFDNPRFAPLRLPGMRA
jgi:hypothetical protein